jgi:hypothetical protein
MVSGASGAARLQKAQSWKGPNTIGTRERAWQKRQKTRRAIQRPALYVSKLLFAVSAKALLR